MSKNCWRLAACVVAMGMALTPEVSAQRSDPQPASVRRPYRGIFGAPPDPSAPQSLVVSGSLYEAYDDNLLAGLSEGRIRTSWLQRSGTYWGASAALNYRLSKQGERVSFGAQSDAQLQYRQVGASHVTPYYNGDVNMDARLTRSTTLGARQSLSFTPNYSHASAVSGGGQFGNDLAIVDDPDLGLFPLQALRTSSDVSLNQRLGRNTTVEGGYNFRTVNINQADLQAVQGLRFRDYRSHAGTLNVQHSKPLTPNATLVLGYGVRVSDRGGVSAEPRLMHDLTAGVNYSRPLSFSRRTSFSFSTGSALVNTRNLQRPDAQPRNRLRFLGTADLNHEMGRTWTTQLSYARGLASRDGFGALYFTDAVTANVSGLISRRLSFSGSGVWAVSTLDIPGRNGHDRTSATVQATYALTKSLGLYTRYVYYRYQYGADIPLDPRLARGLDRQGVRVGLMASVPLLR